MTNSPTPPEGAPMRNELADLLDELVKDAPDDELFDTDGNIWRVMDDGSGNPMQDLVGGGDPKLTPLFVAYRNNHDTIVKALRSLAAVRAPGDEEVAEAIRLCRAWEDLNRDGDTALADDCGNVASILSRLSASYSAACGERDTASKERDEAQSLVTAWQDVFESIEAHIKDRMAMRDPAEPETYLRIIHSDIASVIRSSKQISASRWHDYAQHQAQVATAETQLSLALVERDRARTDALEEAANCAFPRGKTYHPDVALLRADIAVAIRKLKSTGETK